MFLREKRVEEGAAELGPAIPVQSSKEPEAPGALGVGVGQGEVRERLTVI